MEKFELEEKTLNKIDDKINRIKYANKIIKAYIKLEDCKTNLKKAVLND